MRILYLLTCLVFMNNFIHAQLHVVKDNINCLYGLKNEQNAWVVKPKYVDISQNRGFDVYDGLHHGLLSENGELVIPVAQDLIQYHTNYILCTRNNKIRVFTTGGKPLTEQVFDRTRQYGFSSSYLWCYKDSSGSILTSLLQLNNRFLFKDVPGYVQEWYDSTYTIIQKYEYSYQYALGVLDSNGVIVIPQLYNDILIKRNYFIARKPGATVILNHKNEILLGPVSYLRSMTYTSGKDLFIAVKEDSACSLIGQDLKPIIPFGMYDKITPVSNRNLYQVFRGAKTGILDSAGNIRIPLVYDEIIPIFYTGSPKNVLSYLYKINGRYGFLNEKGDVILKAEFDLPVIDIRYPFITSFLIKDKAIYYIDRDGEVNKMDLLFENTFGSFYFHTDFVVCVKYDKKNKANLFVNSASETLTINKEKDLIYLHEYISDRNYDLHVFDLKGKEILPGQLQSMYRWSYSLLNIKTKSRKNGLLDRQTHKLIVDTAYFSIMPGNPYARTCNQVWAKSNPLGGYYIFDTLGKPYTPTVFDSIYNYNKSDRNYVAASAKGGMGIISKNFKWVVEPTYDYAEPVSGDYNLVMTHSRHIGLIDSENHIVADTVYKDFVPVFSNTYPGLFSVKDTINGFTADKTQTWWMLRDHEKRLLINNKGRSISSGSSADKNAEIIDSILFESAFKGAYYYVDGIAAYEDEIKPDGSHNIAEGAFKIILNKEDKAFLMKQPYIKELYQMLVKCYYQQLKKYEKNVPQSKWFSLGAGVTTQTTTDGGDIMVKQICSFSEHYVSLYASRLDSNGFTTQHSFENYIVKQDKLYQLFIIEVFGSEAIFREELLLAIRKSNDLVLDCSTPEGFVENVGGRFTLSNKGILLYIDNSMHNQQELLIPLERVKAHKESEWIIPYLK